MNPNLALLKLLPLIFEQSIEETAGIPNGLAPDIAKQEFARPSANPHRIIWWWRRLNPLLNCMQI
jgi:hypothetical protein